MDMQLLVKREGQKDFSRLSTGSQKECEVQRDRWIHCGLPEYATAQYKIEERISWW